LFSALVSIYAGNGGFTPFLVSFDPFHWSIGDLFSLYSRATGGGPLPPLSHCSVRIVYVRKLFSTRFWAAAMLGRGSGPSSRFWLRFPRTPLTPPLPPSCRPGTLFFAIFFSFLMYPALAPSLFSVLLAVPFYGSFVFVPLFQGGVNAVNFSSLITFRDPRVLPAFRVLFVRHTVFPSTSRMPSVTLTFSLFLFFFFCCV